MTDAKLSLPNGLTINAEQPRKHAKPQYCKDCRLFYYYGDHFCLEKEKEPMIKKTLKGPK